MPIFKLLFNQICNFMNEKVHSINSPDGKLIEIDGINYQVIEGKLYRYANLTLDKAFKIVFGRIGSEDVLKHLLNRILGTCITRLEYRNTEHPGMTEEERASRFDVYCEDEDGTCFQVEMQNWSQKYFHKRAVYYSSLVIQDQAGKAIRKAKEKAKCEAVKGRRKKSRWDYNFQPLYVISILNFKNWTSENVGIKINDYISLYRYTDVETGNELGDGTNLVFIDLYGFKKTLEECDGLIDFWMYSIKNMFSLTVCPDKIKGTEIEELFLKSELAKMSQEQRIKIAEELMTENDILNSIAEQVEDARAEAIDVGRAEGRVEGRAEGLAEGRAEGRAEVIRQMLVSGISASAIAEALGMTEDQCNAFLA